MAIAHVQDAHANTTAASSQTVALTGVTRGNLLMLSIFTGNGAAVASVTDNQGGLWIRAASANSSGSSDVEIWYASGVNGGNTTVTVTLVSVSATDFTLTISEFSGAASVNALDLETANAGTSNTPNFSSALSGYEIGEVFVGACKTTVAVTSTPSGFTAVTTGKTGDSMVYFIDSGITVLNPAWGLGSAPLWLALMVALVPPAANDPGINQTVGSMPQLHCEISLTSNPFAPVWRNAAKYLQRMDTHIGKNHGLDRFEAGELSLTLDGRDGAFNAWNTSSPYYAAGVGLLPMTPIKITASWLGITYYIAYGYLDEDKPVLFDSMNETVTIHGYDILEFLQNALLSNNNYAVLVEGGGASYSSSNLKAYWRCGDQIGVNTLSDSSGNGNTATMLNGRRGLPLLGNEGFFLYDSNNSLDLTNGSNAPNGGFSAPCPIASQANWSFETWMQYKGPDLGSSLIASGTITSGDNAITGVSDVSNLEVGWLVFGSNIPVNSQIIEIDADVVYMSQNATASGAQGIGFAPLGTLFTTSTTAGEVDVRLGAYTSGSGVSYTTLGDRVLVGTLSGGELVTPAISTTPVLDINLHHIVITVAAGTNSTVKIYIDGNLDSTWTFTGINLTPSGGANTVVVGSNAGPFNPFAGAVQDVALYNVVLSAADVLSHYNQGKWFTSVETGAGTSGANSGRINKVLSVAGFPAGLVAVPQTFKTSLYAENSPITTTSALDYLQRIAETEPGAIFQGPDGNIYALSRQYIIGQGSAVGLMNPAHCSTSQGTFGDVAGATYRFQPGNFGLLRDKQDLYNHFQTQSGRPVTTQNPVAPVLQEFGPVQDSRMAQSKTNFGGRVYQGLTQLLWQRDADAASVAQWGGITYGSGELFRPQISLSSKSGQGTNNPQMFGRQIFDRVTVAYQGLTPGSEFGPTDFLIEHIAHSYIWDESAESPSWETSWILSPFEINYASGIGANSELTVAAVAPIVLGTWTFGSTGQLTL